MLSSGRISILSSVRFYKFKFGRSKYILSTYKESRDILQNCVFQNCYKSTKSPKVVRPFPIPLYNTDQKVVRSLLYNRIE